MIHRPVWCLLILFLASGCVTSKIPDPVASEIPEGSTEIVLQSDSSAGSYYDVVYRGLAREGFSFENQDDDRRTLTTGFREVGQETALQISVFVEEMGNGSQAILRGKWGLTNTMSAGVSAGVGANVSGGSAEQAAWGERGRPEVAFGEMVMIAREIPHSELVYSE